jgi:hypothetical protein
MSAIGGPGGGSSSTSVTNTSIAVGGGNSTYSNKSNDFAATPTVGTKNIVLSAYASMVFSSSISVESFLNAIIKRISSAGAVDTLPMTTLSWSASTNTLTLTDMTSNFAVGDSVAVYVIGPDKGYDEQFDLNKISGNAAAGSVDVGNPVKTGGVYQTSAPVYTNGQRGNFQIDAGGNQKMVEQYAAVAEDNTNGVIAIVRRPLAVSTYAPTAAQSNSFTTTNLKASTGNVYGFSVINTSGADRYLQFHNTATTPGGGATAAFKFLVPAGTMLVLSENDWGGPLTFTTGIAYANSTAAATYTAGTAGDLLLDVFYK